LVPLIYLCYGRSGDKGDSANIGLIARKPEYYDIIKSQVTSQARRMHIFSLTIHFAKVVGTYMSHLIDGSVTRYDIPGINGLNFVLTKSLGGGGTSSLRIDR
jgi:hypothetical protein